MNTGQCAPICLSHSCLGQVGSCPSAADVWTEEAVKHEFLRRPTGPLLPHFAVDAH
jgi:hypothetical protein